MSFLRRLLRVPVTRRSAPAGVLLRTVDAHGVAEVAHVLSVPPGACPVSGNPLSGTLTLRYQPGAVVVEVVTLHAALAWACSGAPGAPRSVEALAGWAAREVSGAVGVPVVAVVDLVVRPGRQRLTVTARA